MPEDAIISIKLTVTAARCRGRTHVSKLQSTVRFTISDIHNGNLQVFAGRKIHVDIASLMLYANAMRDGHSCRVRARLHGWTWAHGEMRYKVL